MERTRRRKIGKIVAWEGPSWCPVLVVKDKFSRALGTGSFDTPTINGVKYHRWRGWLENNKGIKERKSLYAPTMAELKRKVAAAQEPAANREGQKLTLESYLKNYFLPGIKPRVAANTYGCYSRAVKLHIVPSIGAAKLTAVQPKHVDAWLSDLAASKTGARAAQQAFMVLKRGYNYAIDLDLPSGTRYNAYGHRKQRRRSSIFSAFRRCRSSSRRRRVVRRSRCSSPQSRPRCGRENYSA